MDSSKPQSYGEAMSSLCNCRMKHYSRSYRTLCFTPDSTSVISEVSRAIEDSCTFEFLIIHSNDFYLNALVTFFLQAMHGLIDHFTSLLWTWAIIFPHFVEALFPWRYALDMLHWSKSLIGWTLFWCVFFDGFYIMDAILDMTKFLLSSIFFVYFQ